MTTVEEIKNYALLGAVVKDDLEIARKLLTEGADPNYPVHLVKTRKKLVHFALKQKQIDMVKVLVEYGANVDEHFLDRIFQFEYHRFTKELVACIIQRNKETKFIQKVFDQLAICFECPEPELSVEIFKLLLDHGLPVDTFINYDYTDNNEEDLTPLQLSLIFEKNDFVALLVESGVDVNKKTINGRSPLYLAVEYDIDASVVKLLLSKGALVNEINLEGKTALLKACESNKVEVVKILLEWDADFNICDGNGDLLLKYAVSYEVKKILAKEIAKGPHVGKGISTKILDFLIDYENDDFRELVRNCYLELKRMKKYEFYDGLSLFDVFQLNNQRKKLTALTKNKNFVKAFESIWNRELFKNYGEDLENIFKQAVERRDILQIEQEKLTSVFKYYLPDLVIREISYYSNEHLFIRN